jgi:hypothetical protein
MVTPNFWMNMTGLYTFEIASLKEAPVARCYGDDAGFQQVLRVQLSGTHHLGDVRSIPEA